jgi:hypothetical protein
MPICTKKPYETQAEGRRALAILRRRGYPELTAIYWCVNCQAWHTTSKKQSGRRIWKGVKLL